MDGQVGLVRVPLSPDEVAAHREHDHLAAIFTDRPHATAAVEELRSLGLGSEHLGVAVRSGDTVVFEHDESTDLARDTGVGAFAGVPLGAIAGIGLAALAIPGIGVIGLGGTLAVAGVSALWGGLLGAYTGAAVGDVAWTAHEDLSYTALQDGEVLVVVCSHGHADDVRDVMRRHAGRLHSVEPHPG